MKPRRSGLPTMADIERLGALMPVYPGRIHDDDWIGRARRPWERGT